MVSLAHSADRQSSAIVKHLVRRHSRISLSVETEEKAYVFVQCLVCYLVVFSISLECAIADAKNIYKKNKKEY